MDDAGGADARMGWGWRIALGAGCVGVLLAGAALWRWSPAEAGLPGCPTREVLGVVCPGCGTTRAAHLMLRGDVAGAIRHNPAAVFVGVPLGAAAWCIAAWGAATGRRFAGAPWMAWVLGAVVCALLVYGALRNVPALEWLRPPGAG